jgi:6-phosphogluconolactonase (cycloisomerase 2 family)
VPDKGLDRVFAFRLDPANGKITLADPPFAQAREGAGPRHVTFHPTKPLAYVMNELDSTITTYRYDAETAALTPAQIVPTIPESFTGDNTGAEIEIARSGKFVFGSNRGHDSIVTMSVDADSGLLNPLSWTYTQGKGPRFFTVDLAGKLLYAANENSDTVVGFRIDEANGKLTPSGHVVQTGSPVCLVFTQAP